MATINVTLCNIAIDITVHDADDFIWSQKKTKKLKMRLLVFSLSFLLHSLQTWIYITLSFMFWWINFVTMTWWKECNHPLYSKFLCTFQTFIQSYHGSLSPRFSQLQISIFAISVRWKFLLTKFSRNTFMFP